MEPFEHPSVTIGGPDALIEQRSRLGERQAAVRVDESGVLVDGKLAIARAAIESAHVAYDELVSVVVTPRSPARAMSFRFSRVDDARRMLESLGFELERTTATFRFTPQLDITAVTTASRNAAIVVVGAVAAFALVAAVAAHFFGFGVLGVLVLAPAVAFAMLGTSSLAEVGTDGVRARSLGINRFFSFSALEGVSHDGEALTLALRSGRRVSLSLSSPDHVASASGATDEQLADALANIEPEGSHE